MILILITFSVVLFVYSWFIEPTFLSIDEEKVAIDTKKLKKPVRILFISDLHIGRLNSFSVLKYHLQKLFDLHSKLPFDLILLGGDFFDRESSYLPRLSEIMAILQRFDVPMYGVLGNHDYHAFSDVSPLLQALKEGNVTILENVEAVITIKDQPLLLIGLADLETHKKYVPNLKKLSPKAYIQNAKTIPWYQEFEKLHLGLPRILLSHNPDGVFLPGNPRPDLVLSGHTHGGQFLPLALMSRHLMRIMPAGSFITESGRRLLEGTTLLISRGISGSFFPARLFCPPQAMIVTLEPVQTPQKLVIGLAGKPRSGKDTVATMIESLLPDMTKVAFGNAIKDEFDAIHGTDTRHNEKEKIANRDAINEFGASKREIDRLYWVKKTINQSPPLLITDVRQPQEVEAVRSAEGVLIRIQTEHTTIAERMGEHKNLTHHLTHKQESHLDDYAEWDFVIENNGTLKDLQGKVESMCTEILEKYSL